MKQGSPQSAVAFITALVLLSAGARLLRPQRPLVPADAAGLDLAAYRARAQRALDTQRQGEALLAKGERIAINRAGAKELARLPGVGPGLAGRIVADRQKHGGFRTTADLTRVPGIGERTARELAGHLDFSGAAGGAGVRGGSRSATAGGSSRGAEPLLPPPASRYDVRRTGPDASVVDLNRASAGDLQRLHGIGPALARRIIAYRDSAGPFRSVDQLMAVPGIGPATLKRLRTQVGVGGRR